MTKVYKSADISKDSRYRYLLTRFWDLDKPKLLFIGINPSTADGYVDDPTILRLIGFTKSAGYGGFCVINLFAYRASKVHVLKEKLHVVSLNYLVGPENNKYIRKAIKNADKVVCMWGRYSKLPSLTRANEVYEMIPQVKRFCFGYNNDDSPTHPLFARNPLKLQPFYLLKSSPSD